jgi:SAM-dependent methyltransferase
VLPPDLESSVELDGRTRASVAAYDEHARAYQESLRLKRPVADVRRFAAFARRDDLVLDAGCGPANDLRLLRDAGVHPVGLDLSFGALREARMLLPRHPLVRAPLHLAPFTPRSFGGLWISGGFTHLPKGDWAETFALLLELVDRGPVYFACYRGEADLQPIEDPVLGEVHVSEGTERDVAQLYAAHGLVDVTLEIRPDPIQDRRRPWVVALGRRPA